MLKHSDVCKYTCEMCNAKFKRSKAFKEHLIAVHTKIRAYTCDWCEKTFSNGANCRKHKKEAHADELKEKDKSQTKKQVQLPKIKELLTSNLVKKKP
jgi:Zinc-finger of C2H2 type